ncbi:MAG: protease complex subunit PrcB family protein [Velocimicrobium sp.]
MKKRVSLIVLVLLFVTIMQGCSFDLVSKDKVRDLSYTIVPEEDVPEELKAIIEEKKAQAFQLSYTADDDLYIVIGYGEQNTGGYSIVLEELYATDNAIMISTNLLGPSKDEDVEEVKTYPYMVVKTEYLDLPVEYLGVENNFAE